MKRILIMFNHLQVSDGVARTAVALANALCVLPGVSATLCPLFRYDRDALDLVDSRVRVRPVFRFYFRGLVRVLNLFPARILHGLFVRERYDIEIGYCMTLPIKVISAGANDGVKRYAWMHAYDSGLKMRREYHRYDKVICVSRCSSERLSAELHGYGDIDYAYNLIDAGNIVGSGGEYIEEEYSSMVGRRPILVSVGRLSPEKGFDRLIRCARQLKEDGLEFWLWIIGGGPEERRLQSLIGESDLGGCVRLIGPRKNPHAYTSKADLFVCPSYSEGYSTACTEALVLGVPVISTDVGGAREMMEDAGCGLVVGNGGDGELYCALKGILEEMDILKGWRDTLQGTKRKFSGENRIGRLLKVLGLDS